MAISEKSRSTIYASFTELMGEEAAAEMMRYLPVRDVDEPATRADLELGLEVHRSQLAGMKVDVAHVESSLRSEIAGLRADVGQVESSLRSEIAGLRADVGHVESSLGSEIAGLRAEVGHVESSLGSEIAGLRADVAHVESSLRSEIAAVAKDVTVLEANLRVEMHRMHNRLLAEIGILIGIATTVLAVLR